MARFHFRLQTLLRLREAVRDQRRMQLAEALQAEQIVRQQLEQLSAQADQLKEQMRAAGRPGKVDVDQLLASHRYRLLLDAQRQNLQEQAGKVAEEVQRRRQAVVEADRQVKVLQRLRQKQLEAYNQEQNKQEQKRLDEVAARCRPADHSER